MFTFTVGFANNQNITIKSPTNVKRQEALSQSFLQWLHGWPTQNNAVVDDVGK